MKFLWGKSAQFEGEILLAHLLQEGPKFEDDAQDVAFRRLSAIDHQTLNRGEHKHSKHTKS